MTTEFAAITGVTAEAGGCPAELRFGKGCVVLGSERRASSLNTGRVDHLFVDPHEPGALHHARGRLDHGAHRFGVEKLLFPVWAPIYPRLAPQLEDTLLTGSLAPTNLYGPSDTTQISRQATWCQP